MPSINFKGKNAVWNHHLSVPYQTLEKDKKLSVKGKNEDENLIIEADNLIALKSLLPKYQGRIKCIYIDPPYNTGNENWVYNDKINSPLIKDWIKQTVSADDLTRHDKWLCMMTPRLKLLQELLSDDGAIFISIDNIEVHNILSLMNEIFLPENFVGVLIWRKKEGGGQTDQYFVTEHEYIVVYKKSDKFKWLDEKIPQDSSSYNKKDKDGEYKAVKLAKWGSGARKEDRPTMCFPLIAPDGKKVYPVAPDGNDGRWRVGKVTMERLIENNLIDWVKKDSKWLPYEKIYFEGDEIKVIKERSIIYDLSYTGDGTKELLNIFGAKDYFDNPKPSELIKYLITYSSEKDSIILDSYAGSGTTAHAVLKLNKEDKSSNRKYILVQLPEEIKKDKSAYKAGFRYVHEITRERVKKVIEKDKLDVGFSYMKLGPRIDADSILSGSLPTYKELAKYVYYLATGKTMDNEKSIDEKNYFVGKINGESIYLLYEKDKDKLKGLAITLDWAEKIGKKDKGKKIIYAPACFLDEEYLEKFNIHFVSIPYSLFEKK
ncbi:MAG: site-specific DNA-methyltransferase [Candidatus Omnitrophota bacterium]|nr:site-specific DNA-methyltransferase [Candidatus Omnitrophota bacterium]